MKYTQMNFGGPGLAPETNLMDAIAALYEVERSARRCGIEDVKELGLVAEELVLQQGHDLIKRLRREALARQQPKVVRVYEPKAGCCGGCRHFQPEDGRASGICTVRPKRDKWGHVLGPHAEVFQSRRRCTKEYEPLPELRAGRPDAVKP